MNLNVNTLVIALSITNLMQVAVMFTQYRKNKANEGPGWWTVGGLCAALGFAFFEFRNLPNPYGLLSIIINNSLSLIALTIIYIGVKRFLGLRENKWALTSFCTVFVLLNIFFTIPPFYNYVVRRTMLLAGVAVISLLIGRCFYKYRSKMSAFWANFLSIGFLSFGVICTVGIILTLTVKQLANADARSIMQTGMYAGVIFASTLWRRIKNRR